MEVGVDGVRVASVVCARSSEIGGSRLYPVLLLLAMVAVVVVVIGAGSVEANICGGGVLMLSLIHI